MKKLVICLLALVFIANLSFANQLQTEVIETETLTGVSDTTSGDIYVGDSKRVTFFITYDQDGTTVGITTTITVAISADGTNWHDVSWFDVAGGATAQTSEELTDDATYAGWLDTKITAPHIRIRATSTGAIGENADITVTVVEDK